MNAITWDLEPVEGEWSTSTWLRWQTRCGLYQVHRITQRWEPGKAPPKFAASRRVNLADGGIRWDVCEYDRNQGRGYPAYYDTLEQALRAVERYHCKLKGWTDVESNRDALLAAANGKGGSESPPAAPSRPERSQKPAKARLLDPFGFSVESDQAKLNATLTREPKKLSEMMTEAGVGGSYHLHMILLVKSGKVRKEEGGYRLA